MNWLIAVILLLCAVHYIKCTEHGDYYNKDKGLIFDAFPGSILSFPINTKDIQQQTTKVPDKMECVFACIGVPWCRSMNFQTTTQNNGLHVCELLSTDKHTHPNKMTQNSTFTHLLFIKNPCAESNPCLNGGTCILHNNRQDYRCECKKGFDGSNCQNDGIRLRGGASDSEGRVEVYHNGQWGTVCDDAWDMNDARVVCRQLGFGGAQSAPGNAAYGQGSDPTWMDNVNCGGSEGRLQDCSHSGWGIENCGHNEDASVVCTR